MSPFPGPPTTSPPPLPGEAPRRQACPSHHLSLASWGCSLRPWPALRATLGARELRGGSPAPRLPVGPGAVWLASGQGPSPSSGASRAPPARPLGCLPFQWHVWSPSPSLPTPWIVRKFFPRVGELGPCPELPTPPCACRPCWWEGTHQPKGLAQILGLEGDGDCPGAPCCEHGVGVNMGPLWRQAPPGPCQLCPLLSCQLVPGALSSPPTPSVPSAHILGPTPDHPRNLFCESYLQGSQCGERQRCLPWEDGRESAQSCPRPEANWKP